MNKFVKPIEIHNYLNPKLWDGDKLRPEVENSLIRIAKRFYEFLGITSPIIDIQVTGSQANYNYTDKSDLDLHLLFDFSKISCDEPIEELFDTKRKLWKEQHDIEIYNIPVELYAEDISKPAVTSNYSILEGEWINHPDIPKINYNVDQVKRLVNLWNRVFARAIKSKNSETCRKVIDLLQKYRKLGLAKYGEFGVPNLVYKSLRNMGAIEKLVYNIRNFEDEDLGLD